MYDDYMENRFGNQNPPSSYESKLEDKFNETIDKLGSKVESMQE